MANQQLMNFLREIHKEARIDWLALEHEVEQELKKDPEYGEDMPLVLYYSKRAIIKKQLIGQKLSISTEVKGPKKSFWKTLWESKYESKKEKQE